MVRGAGLEPAKALFPVLLASGAKGVSLPFIARRITNKTFCLQVLFGNEWHLWAKNLCNFRAKFRLVQILCKHDVALKSVQILCKLFAVKSVSRN